MNPYFFYPLLLSIVCSLFSQKEDTNNPNIILLMADDQGWGDVGYNGNNVIQTPNLDQMSKDGITFSRFYAAAPVCSPTRGSCLTGRHPFRYGIYFANTGKMRKEEITLAEALKSVGYRTGHFGKWHLGTLTNDEIDSNRGGQKENDYSPPWENGFDECFSTEAKVPTWNPMITPEKEAEGVGNKTPGELYGTHYWTGAGEKVSENLEGDDARVIMDRVIPFIKNCNRKEQPFLSVVWFHTPHSPVVAGEKYKQIYADQDNDTQHFYGTISALDEQVGRLRATLEDLGIAENTVIFYTSDNGPEGNASRPGRYKGSAGGLKGRKRSLHEGGIRVPGIMVWPEKINGGTKSNIPVSTSDYYPTVLDMLDLKIPNQPKLDGMSILPIISGKIKERPKPIGFQSKDQLAFIGHNYKIYSGDKGNTFQLYNLHKDPKEELDLSATFPDLKNKMVNQLNEWVKSCQKSDLGEDY